jgi:hypothetical protein
MSSLTPEVEAALDVLLWQPNGAAYTPERARDIIRAELERLTAIEAAARQHHSHVQEYRRAACPLCAALDRKPRGFPGAINCPPCGPYRSVREVSSG